MTQVSNQGKQNGTYEIDNVKSMLIAIVFIHNINSFIDLWKSYLFSGSNFVRSTTGATRQHAIVFTEPWEEFHELNVE